LRASSCVPVYLVTTLSVVTSTPWYVKTSVLPKMWFITDKTSGKVTFLGVQVRHFVLVEFTFRPIFVNVVSKPVNVSVEISVRQEP
jgi:hypothetical protein